MNPEEKDYIQKLAPDMYFVQAPNKARFPFCNGFLITGRENILIDAGLGDELIRDIDDGFHIHILLISHSHPDHILRWHLLEDRKLYLPEETPDSVRDLFLLGKRFTGTEEGGLHWERKVGQGLGIKPLREPDMVYGNGFIFDNGGDVSLEAIHVPGHLDDHYCFIDKNSGTLLTTDIDFTSFGPWYANPEGDIKLFIKSIKRVMALDHIRACSSHRPPEEGNALLRFQAFLDTFERQRNEVLELCNSPKNIEGLVSASPFYRDKLPDKIIQGIFERSMILKNLSLLIIEGKVREDEGLYVKV